MIPLKLKYRPIDWLPLYITFKIFLPVMWSELSKSQFFEVSQFRRDPYNFRMLSRLLNIRLSVLRKIDDKQIFTIVRYLTFLKESEPLGYFIIDEISGLKAPKDFLNDLSFGNFILGDIYHSYFLSGEREFLDKFVACFYGSPLIFDPLRIEENAQLIAKEDPRTREAIAVNYELIQEYMYKKFPYSFINLQKAREIKMMLHFVPDLGSCYTAKLRLMRDNFLTDHILDDFKVMNRPVIEIFQAAEKIMQESGQTSDYAEALKWFNN